MRQRADASESGFAGSLLDSPIWVGRFIPYLLAHELDVVAVTVTMCTVLGTARSNGCGTSPTRYVIMIEQIIVGVIVNLSSELIKLLANGFKRLP